MAFKLRPYMAPDFTEEKFVKAPDVKMVFLYSGISQYKTGR